MKIYIADFSYYGGIVVIANSIEEAFSMMKNQYNWDGSADKIEEHEITHGFLYCFLGDS